MFGLVREIISEIFQNKKFFFFHCKSNFQKFKLKVNKLKPMKMQMS